MSPDQLVYQPLNYTKQRDLEDNITQQEYVEFLIKIKDQQNIEKREKVRSDKSMHIFKHHFHSLNNSN